MSNNITPEMLTRYLDNELDAGQRQVVESALSGNDELQQQLQRLQLAKQAFKQFATRQKIASIHQEMMKELPRRQPAGFVRYLRITMRFAALLLVLLLVAGVVQYSLLDAERLYRSHYDAYTLGTSRDDANIPAIEQAYRRNDMLQVIALYESGSAQGRQPADHFLAGQAYLATDNPQKAIPAFEAQLQANASRTSKSYQDDAEYYLALAWLKAGRADKALPLFQLVHNQKAHAYNREVSGWYLTQLRWLQRKQED
jgi:tetratricopeptide (TPR) repeat protein